MKEVMFSINPKWVELILNGKKTVEVRKTTPKEIPFKGYIYKTKGKFKDLKVWTDGEYNGRGKVVAEFICNKVEHFVVGSLRCDDIEKKACLSYKEMINYFYKSGELDGKTIKYGYAIHISDLVIYDEPKDLGEFKKAGFLTNEEWLYALYPNTHCHYEAWAKNFEITRPPQSWQQVRLK